MKFYQCLRRRKFLKIVEDKNVSKKNVSLSVFDYFYLDFNLLVSLKNIQFVSELQQWRLSYFLFVSSLQNRQLSPMARLKAFASPWLPTMALRSKKLPPQSLSQLRQTSSFAATPFKLQFQARGSSEVFSSNPARLYSHRRPSEPLKQPQKWRRWIVSEDSATPQLIRVPRHDSIKLWRGTAETISSAR